jgi:hypothetical protein
VEVAAHWHAQNTGGSRMRPVAKYMARSGAIHRNHIKAASRNATMNPPINAWSCVRRSCNHCNLLGIYSLVLLFISGDYEEFIGAKKHLVLGLLSHTGPPQRSNSFAIG